VYLGFFPWELVVDLLDFLWFVPFEVEDVVFFPVVVCVDFGLDFIVIDEVLVFIMVLLLRLIYILSISYNLLLIIRMKEIRDQIPLEIL
jgi:NADH:ubiquinone oxidoreductase subunit 3 (subunit A)